MVWYQEGTITGPDQGHFWPSSGFLVAVNFMFSTFTRLRVGDGTGQRSCLLVFVPNLTLSQVAVECPADVDKPLLTDR